MKAEAGIKRHKLKEKRLFHSLQGRAETGKSSQMIGRVTAKKVHLLQGRCVVRSALLHNLVVTTGWRSCLPIISFAPGKLSFDVQKVKLIFNKSSIFYISKHISNGGVDMKTHKEIKPQMP